MSLSCVLAVRRELLDCTNWDYDAFRAEHLEQYLVDTVEAFMKEMNYWTDSDLDKNAVSPTQPHP